MISVVDKKSDPAPIENMHSLHGVVNGLSPLDIQLQPINTMTMITHKYYTLYQY